MPRPDSSNQKNSEGGERLDKWLWGARFYKTRTLAAEAIDKGRVEVNGVRSKRSRTIKTGDVVSVREGPLVTTVNVLGLAQRRGSAEVARTLYSETDESRKARELFRAHQASLPRRDAGDGRPSKRDRREIRRLRGE